MNVPEFRAQLEEELSWRLEEILFFQNQGANLTGQEGDKYRRSLILILYSNFEGLCKFSLSLYVAAVNNENIDCSAATHAIAAASLSDVFLALRDPVKKTPAFSSELPDDSKLHRFARDREFVKNTRDIMSRKVKIPDNYIDTESNLKPIVLRKNLYKLGLAHDQFSEIESDIDRLLNIRNEVAHGASRSGVSLVLYEKLRQSTLHVMREIVVAVANAFADRHYLAHPEAAGIGSS